MAKISLTEPLSGYNLAAINANFVAIEAEFQDKVLYRDNPVGEANALETDIDANSKRLYNLPEPTLPSEAARLQDVQNAIAGASVANLITSTPAGGLAATNVQAALNELDTEKASVTQLSEKLDASDLSAPDGASLVGFMPAGVGAIATTVQAKLREGVSVLDFGTDIQKALQYVFDSGGGTVTLARGMGYTLTTPLIIGSRTTLDLNAGYLTGGVASGSIAFDPNGLTLIDSGYNLAGVLTSNRNLALNAQRVIDMVIKNGYLVNANRGMFLSNCNEGCLIEDVNYSGVSRATTIVSCFYMKMIRSIARTSAQSAAGQILHHLTYTPTSNPTLAGNNNEMEFDAVGGAGQAVCFAINGIANFALAFNNCHFEEGKAAVSSIGILAGADAYISGLSIHNAYVEGVNTGLAVDSGGTIYGGSLTDSIFNNNQYAVLCSGSNGLKLFTIDGNSLPDGGGTDRNLIEISPAGNDVRFRRENKTANITTGPTAYPATVLPGAQGVAQSTSTWTRTFGSLDAIGRASPSLANQNYLNELPFEGANIVTVPNEPPFVALTRAVNTLTIDTSIAYDLSNVLVFNFYGNTDSVNWDLKGFIFGTTVSWVTHDPIGVTATVSNNGGYVRIVFGNLTAAVPIINVNGMVRHV